MNDPLRLTVLGTGYLGTTHAACMASLGFDVLGVDTDARKVDQLNAGQLPIYEPGLRELHSGLGSGRLAFTTSYPQAAAFGDVHFICAGTPPQPGSHHADLSQVHGCIAALAPLLDRRCLVAGKSTVPVGTARRLAAELAEACRGVELAWNPEFLRESSAVADALTPDRIVAGVMSPWAEEVLRQVYARSIAADLACELVNGDLAEVPVCVLGAAFKPGSDDVRDSPALDVAQILHGMGARVTVYDPAALANARGACPELGYAATPTEAAREAHVVLLLTEWPEFAELTPGDLGTVVEHRNIVDGRNVLDPTLWRAAGWNFRSLGAAPAASLSTRFGGGRSAKDRGEVGSL